MRTLTEIVNRVSAHAQVPVSDLYSRSRSPKVAQARHLAIYVARELLGLSTTELGRAFGRDHTTVIHSIRATRQNPQLAADAREIMANNATIDTAELASALRRLLPGHAVQTDGPDTVRVGTWITIDVSTGCVTHESAKVLAAVEQLILL